MSEETTAAVEATVHEIRRWTRKKYSAEEKVRIVADRLHLLQDPALGLVLSLHRAG
jgi:hypothetical protein